MRRSALGIGICFIALAVSGCHENTEPFDSGPFNDTSPEDAGDTGTDGDADGDSDADADGDADGDGDGDGDLDADANDADTPADDADVGDDADVIDTVELLLPPAGAEVLYSAALRARAPADTDRVEIVHSATGASCVAEAPAFECLLDTSEAAVGEIELSLTALDATGAELATGVHLLNRRAVEVPCSGDDLNQCVLDRAALGLSAGFEGVSYINADNGHANVNTSAMTGIDARMLDEPPATIPEDVSMGIMNESRAYTSPCCCSLPRCYPTGRQQRALTAYEANVFYLMPEHRDHGTRDYFQWQAPFFGLSQGSSGSERDEVGKGLRALAIMEPDARLAAADSGVLGPILSFLLFRSRLSSDVAYLEVDAHPTTLGDASNGADMLTLAAAMRSDELPPVARVAVNTSTFPDDWSTYQVLDRPYAVGFAPLTTPETPPAGEFEVEIELTASTDPNGRELLFFPAVLRGAATIERLDTAGTRWLIRGEFPEDVMLMTVGYERIVSRTTVGFFPHNGVWLGAPAMVSFGSRAADDLAPNDNNLD